MTADATINSRGQITIPKIFRASLGMKTGNRLTLTLLPDATVILRVKNKKISDVAGLLHDKNRKPLSIFALSI